jgi:arylsulfatase A-like enzyme
MEFINQQTEARPFFLYFALNAPHTPIAPAAQFKGKSQAGDYGDFVVEVDWVVGEILKTLEQRHLSDNTLVIVTSDNGPETPAYQRARQFRHYSMGDWRGVKRDVWEGGHRVPFLARWPGKIKPGSISDEIICETDLMATLAAIVGATLPPDAGEDSYNVLPALLGEPRSRPIREATVHHSDSGKFAIRQGSWVFIDAKSGADSKEPEWFKQERGYQDDDFPAELYDLSRDASERHNLYAEHPEKVKSLKALLEKYKTEGRSAPTAR